MSDSDRIGSDPTDDAVDSGEAGNFVEPVDLGDGGQEVGTDPETDKGDFTTSTDLGTGRQAAPNVERPDGDYTTSQAHVDDATEDGEYTDKDASEH